MAYRTLDPHEYLSTLEWFALMRHDVRGEILCGEGEIHAIVEGLITRIEEDDGEMGVTITSPSGDQVFFVVSAIKSIVHHDDPEEFLAIYAEAG